MENIDSRRKNVCLTDKGQEVAQKSSYVIMKIEEDIFNSWAMEDSQLFIRFTKQFFDDLKVRVRRL